MQQQFFRFTGNLPARRSAWEDPALAQDPRAQAFRDQLERVRPVPKVPEWERIATDLKPRHLDRIVTQRIGFDDLPQAFDAYIQGRVTGRTPVEIG